jgi:hypothetical protein
MSYTYDSSVYREVFERHFTFQMRYVTRRGLTGPGEIGQLRTP